MNTFETMWSELIKPGSKWPGFSILDLADQLQPRAKDPETIAQCLNTAFLILQAGKTLIRQVIDRVSRSQFPLPRKLNQKLQQVTRESQRYWYNHPIQIGVPPQNNELLYGLRGWASTLAFEKNHCGAPAHAKPTCILSFSVTHDGLHDIAREYIAGQLSRSKSFDDLEIYVFTEDDTQLITQGENNRLRNRYQKEKAGWNLEP